MNDITKTCDMKRYHNMSCEHVIDFGCDECPFFKACQEILGFMDWDAYKKETKDEPIR